MEIPAANSGKSREGLPFEAVVAQHWAPVHRLLYRLAGNSHDADDLAQETFLRALDRYESFRADTNLRAWLMRIASNAFFDVQRRRKTARAVSLEGDPEYPDAAQAGPAERAELGDLLAAALVRLTDTQRAVFLLRSQAEFSFREIAEAIGVTEETARWHMLTARRQLMAMLDGRI